MYAIMNPLICEALGSGISEYAARAAKCSMTFLPPLLSFQITL